MRIRLGIGVFVAFAVLAAACAEETPDKIVFGFVPSERVESLGDFVQPYMDYLTQQVGIPFEGVVTADYNGLVVAMGTGGADFGAFGPVGYVQAKAQYDNIGPLMQSARFGSFTYHGQWMTNDPSICTSEPTESAFVNVNGVPTLVAPGETSNQQVGWVPEGDIANAKQEVLEDGTTIEKGLACEAPIESVIGKKVAFGSPTSTSATLYPTLMLIEAGIDPENDIEFQNLSPSHVAAIEAVYNGDFDIGLGFDDSRQNLRKPAEGGFPDVGRKVITFAITPEIPNDLVAVNLNLPDEIIDAVYTATENFLATEEGFAVFQEIYQWTEIRRAVDSDFDVVRRAVETLGIEAD